MKKLAVVLIATMSVTAMAKDRASNFDRDGDRKVSFVELNAKCEVSKGLFEKADKNKDGVLSNSEMKTAKQYLFRKSCDRQNA